MATVSLPSWIEHMAYVPAAPTSTDSVENGGQANEELLVMLTSSQLLCWYSLQRADTGL